MNTNGDYANLEHLSVKEVLSENPIDKIVTLLATDKDENKVRDRNYQFLLHFKSIKYFRPWCWYQKGRLNPKMAKSYSTSVILNSIWKMIFTIRSESFKNRKLLFPVVLPNCKIMLVLQRSHFEPEKMHSYQVNFNIIVFHWPTQQPIVILKKQELPNKSFSLRRQKYIIKLPKLTLTSKKTFFNG